MSARAHLNPPEIRETFNHCPLNSRSGLAPYLVHFPVPDKDNKQCPRAPSKVPNDCRKIKVMIILVYPRPYDCHFGRVAGSKYTYLLTAY